MRKTGPPREVPRRVFRCLWVNMWSKGFQTKMESLICAIKSLVSEIIGNFQSE